MKSKCQNQSANSSHCNCTYEPCPRKGICCECLQYHLPMKQAPACMFSSGAEHSYDRSIANLIIDLNKR